MADFRWGSASHEGQLRAQNEDNAHAGEGLFVVADGMGGHLAGEVASEMAVNRLETRLPAGIDNTLDDLVSAITEANIEIYNGSTTNPDQAGMGTTVTAIALITDPIDERVFGIANVGDSRSYVFRHNRLRQVTVDHSFVQELVAEGAITRAEARVHPRRNIVTRALGIEPTVRVDSWTMPIIRGDRFVLCSDGLVDEIDDDTITEVIRAHPDDPQATAQALVDAANAAGGRDNITVVVLDVLAGDDPPDPTEEFDVIPVWSDDNMDNTGEQEIVTDPLPEHGGDGDETGDQSGTDTTGDAGGPDTGTSQAPYDGGADVPPVPGAATPDVEPEPEPERKSGRFARFVIGLGVAAVLVLGFAILAAWARGGYFVAFDTIGEVGIYQGQQDSVLWFEPTREATGQYTRDQLDEESIELVEQRPEFESQSSAALFVTERLSPTTTTSTTTTTTTTVVTTTTVAEAPEDTTTETTTGN